MFKRKERADATAAAQLDDLAAFRAQRARQPPGSAPATPPPPVVAQVLEVQATSRTAAPTPPKAGYALIAKLLARLHALPPLPDVFASADPFYLEPEPASRSDAERALMTQCHRWIVAAGGHITDMPTGSCIHIPWPKADTAHGVSHPGTRDAAWVQDQVRTWYHNTHGSSFPA
jgi:hypothetical protein